MNTDYLNGTEEEREMFRTWVKGALKAANVTVVFTKTDGTSRIMECTLREDAIIQYEKTTDRVKAINNEVCPVWDLKENAWRSFRYDSVEQITFTLAGDEDEQDPQLV
jgi:hypothetical protein